MDKRDILNSARVFGGETGIFTYCRKDVMFEKSLIKKRVIRQGVVAGSLVALCCIMIAAQGLFRELFFRFYVPFSRWISKIAGFLFSFVPISVAEFLLYGLAVYFVFYAFYVLFKMLTAAGSLWCLLRFAADLLFTVVLAGTLFFVFWGFNYFAPSLESRLGLEVKEQTEEALFQTCMWLVEEINRNAGLVMRNEDGIFDLGGFWEIRKLVPEALKALGENNEVFKGAGLSPPKMVANWLAMSYSGIDGIYFPLTGECNVNPNVADIQLPFTMLHEMAHRGGFAAEEDANYVAYLACLASENPNIRYCGAVMALLYCKDQVVADTLRETINSAVDSRIWNDLSARRDVIENLNPDILKAVSTIATGMNDVYLTTMGQPDGVRSYGRVVNLLIAEYIRISNKED